MFLVLNVYLISFLIFLIKSDVSYMKSEVVKFKWYTCSKVKYLVCKKKRVFFLTKKQEGRTNVF